MDVVSPWKSDFGHVRFTSDRGSDCHDCFIGLVGLSIPYSWWSSVLLSPYASSRSDVQKEEKKTSYSGPAGVVILS